MHHRGQMEDEGDDINEPSASFVAEAVVREVSSLSSETGDAVIGKSSFWVLLSWMKVVKKLFALVILGVSIMVVAFSRFNYNNYHKLDVIIVIIIC